MDTEIVFLGRDNTIDLKLKADGAAVDLSGVTAITASFGTRKISSTSSTSGPITWEGADYEDGEIRLHIGDQEIPVGEYEVIIVVYDLTYDDGIHWTVDATTLGVPVIVLDDMEGS